MDKEIQLTFDAHGHMLNSAQVFSPDDQWIVYDVRNDQTLISQTCCIEKVHVSTGKIIKLYVTPRSSANGPGVGAVAYHPTQNKMIFIHGLLNCDAAKPYGFTRRFGAVLDEQNAAKIFHTEARVTGSPLIPGALRGGTHAHTWSADGKWISFTYNDFLMENLEQSTNGRVKDLRTIGVMSPAAQVTVVNETAEEFSGGYFSVVAATVTETPAPGSDEIDRAFDECWIGKEGYQKKDGGYQRRAIAFQGNVRNKDGQSLTEIFVADIPDDITQALPGKPLQGTLMERPNVPAGLLQRRLTFSAERKYPGVQGPRFWVRSSPDGQMLFFLMKDDDSIVQVFQVATQGGKIQQVTRLPHSVQCQFNVHPDGNTLAIIADNSIWITDISTGKSRRVTPRFSDEEAPVLGVLWNHRGDMLAYNRYVKAAGGRYLQIFKMNVN